MISPGSAKAGGTDKPLICVVTPYHRESLAVLWRCHASVIGQRVEARVVHIMVADGNPAASIDGWALRHLRLTRNNGDYGNTPRAIGGVVAASLGASFIAYLDADNWFLPDHLAIMLAACRQSRAAVVCSQRLFFSPDEEPLGIEEIAENALSHVDTSCYFLHRSAFALNAVWSRMPRQLGGIGDRVFLQAVRHSHQGIHFTKSRSVAYTTTHASHYEAIGRPPPPDAKSGSYAAELAYLASRQGIEQSLERLGFWPG